ncbi:MAG: hypothetical protein AB7S26_35705 [Sandaracinaceae bacterium]
MTIRALVLSMLASAVVFGCATEDYGQALCEGQRDPEPCDFSSACNAAIAQASGTGGGCQAELSAVIAAMPASYEACFNACPVEQSCSVGGVSLDLRACGCQTDCIAAAPESYRTATAAYTSCLESDAAVSSACL